MVGTPESVSVDLGAALLYSLPSRCALGVRVGRVLQVDQRHRGCILVLPPHGHWKEGGGGWLRRPHLSPHGARCGCVLAPGRGA